MCEWVYVGGSLLIAFCIFIEVTMLKRNAGKIPKQKFFGIVSLLTSAWSFLSFAALYFLEFDRWAISVPVAFSIYSVLGWFYGIKLMKGTDISIDPEDLIVPEKYLTFCASFALVFAGLCIFVLMQWFVA